MTKPDKILQLVQELLKEVIAEHIQCELKISTKTYFQKPQRLKSDYKYIKK